VNGRVDRLRAALEEPLLVTNVVNVRYLTGLRSSNAALLVEPDRLRLFADFRYAEAARSVAGVEFVETSRNLVGSLAELLTGRVAFEAHDLTYSGYDTLRRGGLELVPAQGVVERLRRVKDESELEAVKRAAAVGDRAFEQLAEERFVGLTERELAWRMESLLHDAGAEGLSFPVIVAAGPNGANPHTEPGDRAIESGELVVIDAGCVVGGYCSDCTRTFATGELPKRLTDAYDVCLQAQLAGLAAVRSGVSGADADSAAREIVDATPFAGRFGHGLGHGVGLAVHEGPTLRPESEDVLEPGNVVTVEPGIYISGEGGVRIEDLVVVRDDGAEILTSFGKELVTVS
jgi:Xaa-Pro aminopeptidase